MSLLLHPNHAPSHVLRAGMQLHSGQLAAAENSCRVSLMSTPGHVPSLMLLAFVLFQRGQKNNEGDKAPEISESLNQLEAVQSSAAVRVPSRLTKLTRTTSSTPLHTVRGFSQQSKQRKHKLNRLSPVRQIQSKSPISPKAEVESVLRQAAASEPNNPHALYHYAHFLDHFWYENLAQVSLRPRSASEMKSHLLSMLPSSCSEGQASVQALFSAPHCPNSALEGSNFSNAQTDARQAALLVIIELYRQALQLAVHAVPGLLSFHPSGLGSEGDDCAPLKGTDRESDGEITERYLNP